MVLIDANGQGTVEIEGRVCIEEGFLEQVACSPSTREHESLVVVKAKPSDIHYALLLARFRSGSPGRWVYRDDGYSTVDPTGEALDVLVRYTNPAGDTIEQPIRSWIRKATDERDADASEPQSTATPGSSSPSETEFPTKPWVFGGSRFEKNPAFMGPGEHYVADMTGSIIGLVTFGDEVIGYSRVLADQADVEPPVWEVNTSVIPPIDTPVTIILRRYGSAPPDSKQ